MNAAPYVIGLIVHHKINGIGIHGQFDQRNPAVQIHADRITAVDGISQIKAKLFTAFTK